MKNKSIYLMLLIIICVFTNSCLSLFSLKSITFDSALVVEATISNELKYHEINLSRPFVMTESAWGDCTKLGANLIPDFWIN